MATCKITLYGFYKYMLDSGSDLFALMRLPNGVDRNTLIDTLMLKSGEFEVVYSNPEFMQQMIGSWSKKNSLVFERWLKGIKMDYDPINNYDKTSEITTKHTGTIKNDGVNVTTPDTVTETRTQGNVSAFDSSEFTPQNSDTSRTTNTGTDTVKLDNTQTNDTTDAVTEHTYGNIGVSTSSSILKEYLEVQSWNIYDNIADLFIDEFCVAIYI